MTYVRPAARTVAAALQHLVGTAESLVVSDEHLAELTGLTVNTVRIELKSLDRAGLAKVGRRSRATHVRQVEVVR